MKRGVVLVFLLVLSLISIATESEAASLTSCSIKPSCTTGGRAFKVFEKRL